jgi:hypothetical protein
LTRVWARRGSRPRGPRDRRYKWAYIFGAVCPARAATAALVLPKANTDGLSLHLAEIAGQVASGAHAILVLDGAGWHTADDLDVPDNVTLLHLPPYAPELNPVENVWQYLRQTSSPSPSSTATPTSSTNAAKPGTSSPTTSTPSPPSPHDHGLRSVFNAVGISSQCDGLGGSSAGSRERAEQSSYT